MGGGARPRNVPTEKMYARASERLRNICIFRPQNTYVYIYNQCSSPLLFVVWRYKRQHTDKTLTLRKFYEYHASERSERSERAKKIAKTAISFNILSLLQIVYIYFQVSKYIAIGYIQSMQFPLLLVAWRYINDSIGLYRQNTNIEREKYEYANEL